MKYTVLVSGLGAVSAQRIDAPRLEAAMEIVHNQMHYLKVMEHLRIVGVIEDGVDFTKVVPAKDTAAPSRTRSQKREVRRIPSKDGKRRQRRICQKCDRIIYSTKAAFSRHVASCGVAPVARKSLTSEDLRNFWRTRRSCPLCLLRGQRLSFRSTKSLHAHLLDVHKVANPKKFMEDFVTEANKKVVSPSVTPTRDNTSGSKPQAQEG